MNNCRKGNQLLAQGLESNQFEAFEKHQLECLFCQEEALMETWEVLDDLPAPEISNDFELRVMAALPPKETSVDWVTLIEKAIDILHIPTMALCVSLLLVHHTEVQKQYPEPKIQYAQVFKKFLDRPIEDSLKTLKIIYLQGRNQG